MRISEPGTSTEAQHPRARQCGFTLLELLVVIVIIALTVSYVVPRFSGPDAEQRVAEEAQRLAALVSLASDEAILQSRELGLRLGDDGYAFLARHQDRWAPVDDDGLLRARRFAEELEVALSVEGKRVSLGSRSGDVPQVYISPEGGVSAFEIALGARDSDKRYRVTARPAGGIQYLGPES